MIMACQESECLGSVDLSEAGKTTTIRTGLEAHACNTCGRLYGDDGDCLFSLENAGLFWRDGKVVYGNISLSDHLDFNWERHPEQLAGEEFAFNIHRQHADLLIEGYRAGEKAYWPDGTRMPDDFLPVFYSATAGTGA